MKQYECLELYIIGFDSIVIYSTNKEILDWIQDEASKINVMKKVNRYDFGASIDWTKHGNGLQIKWWLIQQIGLQGWIPFAVTIGKPDYDQNPHYYFQKEIENTQGSQ